MKQKIMTCRDIMNQRFAIIDGLTTVSEALKIIKEHQNTVVIIKKRNENDEWGQVQLSDIAKCVIAKDRSPERINCYEIMEKPLVAVRPDMSIKNCARLFDSFGLSSAPVLENEEIIGIVTYNDIVLSWLDFLNSVDETTD